MAQRTKAVHISIRKRELMILEGMAEFAESLTDDVSIELVESKVEGLEESWIHFSEADEKLFELGEDSEYTAAETPYYAAKATFKAFIRRHTPPAKPSNDHHDGSKLNDTIGEFVAHQKTFLSEFSHIQQSKSEAKLPRASIPVFRGDYKEWASFNDLFKGQIHTNPRLSKATKFQYLKGCLADRAAKTIEHIPITDATYEQAWEKLRKRFEKKGHIANAFFQTLTEQPTVTKCSVDQLRSLCDTSDEILRGLTALDQNTKYRDSLVIYILLQKTDPETRRVWAEHVIEKDFPTEDDFLKFLTTRCDSLEMSQIPCTRTETSRVPSRVRTHTVSADIKLICAKCGNNHKLFKCPSFQAMEVLSRRDFTAENMLCFNCLGKAHSSNKCFSPQRCHKCSMKHHTLLHINAITGQQLDKSNQSTSCCITCAKSIQSHIHEQTNQILPTTTPINISPYSTSINTGLQSTSSTSTCQPSNPLHENQTTASSSLVTQSTNISRNIQNNRTSLLPTAIVLVKDKLGVSQPCRALLDSGSQVTLITDSLAQKLQISRNHARIPIIGLAGAGAGYTRGSVQLHIKSRLNYDKTLECQALVLKSLTAYTPEYSTNEKDYQHIKHLPLADPDFTQPSRIDIILGAGEFFEILSPENIKRDNKVIAQNTIFGWIICGTLKAKATNSSSISNVATTDIDVLLRQFWEVEELDPKPIVSEEDRLMESHFIKTFSRTDEGRYVVHLPFKPNSPDLGSSLQAATSRLMAMERKFESNSMMHQQYVQFMDEYINLTHMKPIPTGELHKNQNVCYLPHHAVVKESNEKPKLRVVFDGSARTSSGMSLNDKLLVGPTIQNTLFSTIIKFRKHKIAFASDIEKMYRQILVEPGDQDYQRIVWRRSKMEPLTHYRLQTVTYGLASSPYQAIRSLKQVAIDYQHEFPLAAAVINNDFYVDDVMSGADETSEAIECRDQLIKVLRMSCFNLRKWKSNSIEFLQGIPSEYQEISPLNLEEPQCTKVLGLQWNSMEDCFFFSVDLPATCTPTKRGLLSESSRLFDPLGLLAPSIITIKVLFQSLWVLKLNWDDRLPPSIAAKWENIRNAFSQFATIKIPRLTVVHNHEIEIHGFSDASEWAYAAAVYVRSRNETGNCITRLVAAKTKVAPIKQLSIPRLELCGAFLLTKLIKSVVTSMNIPEVDIFAWTDSTTVLQWIGSPPRKWKTFIGNRTAEIHTILPQCQWRHVSSKENPADHASRGIHPSDLKDLNIWWNGPDFLKTDADTWRNLTTTYQSNESSIEERSKQLFTFAARAANHDTYLTEIILKYSSWRKLLRIFVYIFRYIHKLQSKVRNKHAANVSAITPSELKLAGIALYKQAQNHVFRDEIQQLKAGRSVSSKSKIASLHPFLDETNLIRVGGRLQNANIPYTSKHPIILPGDSHVTGLIIADVHQYTLHGGVSLMLFHLRQQYWILGVRNRVKQYIHKCITCFKLKAKAAKQLMGNLPTVRVVDSKRAFENVGVDYAGPILLKTSTIRNAKIQKAYIALFVCMASKAVHLELVTDLTTEAFIAALRRFTARRGYPITIYSDNGSNFVGADRELRQLAKQFTSQEHNDKINSHLSTHYTTWKFMCPTASHMGGLYEAGVKSTKNHLRRCIGQSILTYEQYYTLLCQVEAVLNSRPLCSQSDDVDDWYYLSPGHFLIGEPLLTIPEPNLEQIQTSRLSKWQTIQQTTQRFWRIFKTDYLNTLQQRYKWQTKEPNLNTGDLVVVIENNLPPTKWQVARIIEVHPGHDNLVRVATIKSINGIFKRPINKLAKLPVD